MRLLKLRFQNINSLAGEYEIDFTNAVLAESGIFAIVGPTGSGKTSILDAVSLALYGETPRTAERPEESKDKAAECQVLTKNRTECYAQVIFEAHGKTWLSRWSRGYGPRSKKLTPEKVELALLSSPDDEAGRIVAEKITDWKAAVTWLLGMDFAGFTRCVLLAQGAFAKLLRAKVDERASILERITGTELYSEIGRTVYRKEAEDKARVERLEAALAGAAPLSDEARGALEAALQAAQAAEKAAVESRRTANQRLEKRRALDAAAAAYMEAKKRSKAAQAALEAAAPERARAAAARRAAKGARALEEKTRTQAALAQAEAAVTSAEKTKAAAAASRLAAEAAQKASADKTREAQAAQKMHYALSAEQLEAVYPDLVYMRPDGTKGINYVELIPILVEAIGELNAKVQQLEQGGKTRLAPMASGSGGSMGKAIAATLGQNSPNPFAATTAIRLSIPTDAKSAQLCIYDMTGRQVRQLPIDARGATSVSVAAAGMPAGMYLYSLIVDDSLIDTKRMVVGQ